MKKTEPKGTERKLILNRETLRSLEERQLARAAGGASHSCNYDCPETMFTDNCA